MKYRYQKPFNADTFERRLILCLVGIGVIFTLAVSLWGCGGPEGEDCWNDDGMWDVTYTIRDNSCPSGTWKAHSWTVQIWQDEGPCLTDSQTTTETINGCEVREKLWFTQADNYLTGTMRVEFYCSNPYSPDCTTVLDVKGQN